MPPWKAMLINFDRASKETSHVTDLKAFCDLLRWMTEQYISENGEVTSHFFYELRERETPFWALILELIDLCHAAAIWSQEIKNVLYLHG